MQLPPLMLSARLAASMDRGEFLETEISKKERKECGSLTKYKSQSRPKIWSLAQTAATSEQAAAASAAAAASLANRLGYPEWYAGAFQQHHQQHHQHQQHQSSPVPIGTAAADNALLLNGGFPESASAYSHHPHHHSQSLGQQQQQQPSAQLVQSSPPSSASGNFYSGSGLQKNGQNGLVTNGHWDDLQLQQQQQQQQQQSQGLLRGNSFSACSPVPFLSGMKTTKMSSFLVDGLNQNCYSSTISIRTRRRHSLLLLLLFNGAPSLSPAAAPSADTYFVSRFNPVFLCLLISTVHTPEDKLLFTKHSCASFFTFFPYLLVFHTLPVLPVITH